MIYSLLRKLFHSPKRVYKSEFYILAIFTLLTIPGMINLIWFSSYYKEELFKDFESRVTNTQQTIVLMFQNENSLTNNQNLNFIRYQDLSNIIIYQSDTLLFALNKNSDLIRKTYLDSLWRLGLDTDLPKYIKKTYLLDADKRITIYTAFDLTNLKAELQFHSNQLWLRAGFIFLTFLVLFVFITMTLLKPIQRLSAETEAVINGTDKNKLSTNYSFPEINHIAIKINELIEKSEVKEKKVIEEIQGLIDYLTSRNEELEYAKGNAESANKYKTEFLANISHEIRTPLNAILGFTEQLIVSETDENKKYYLNVIKNSGRTLIALVNDILDISKIESGRFEINKSPTNFTSLIQEISDLYSSKALSKGLAFIIDNDPNIPQSLILDDLRMRQILINLISNAIKFTEKGNITLSTKLLKLNPMEGKINFLISVKDTGIGISKEYKKQIFEPFTQQEGQSFRKYGGTGLGLPITKKLVELMGGRIDLESEEGLGSEFIVYLNDVELTNKNNLQFTEETIYYRADIAKILLFDKNDIDRELLADTLKNENFVILEVNRFDDFVKYCNSEKIDIVIYCCVDSNPEKVQLTSQVIEFVKHKEIPTIAITNDSTEYYQWRDYYKNTFAAVIKKPIHIKSLINTICKILNQNEDNGSEVATDGLQQLWDTFVSNANPIIIQKIRENFVEKAKELSNKLVLSQIKEFQQELFKFSTKANDPLLNEIEQQLQENITKFQLSNVKKILSYFSNI